MYLRHTPPKHYLDYVVAGKAPVVILPGIVSRWAFLKPLADFLSLQGHPVYIIPQLGNNLRDIPSTSRIVKEVIEENKLQNAVIVAHSKGGLIAKYFLAHENSAGRVKGLVAIATPFSGSAMARLVPHRSFQELNTDSKIIGYLNEHQAVNSRIISIIPSFDNHVWHAEGSFLAGALENINVPVAGHHKIVNDKTVWQKIAESIDKLSK